MVHDNTLDTRVYVTVVECSYGGAHSKKYFFIVTTTSAVQVWIFIFAKMGIPGCNRQQKHKPGETPGPPIRHARHIS